MKKLWVVVAFVGACGGQGPVSVPVKDAGEIDAGCWVVPEGCGYAGCSLHTPPDCDCPPEPCDAGSPTVVEATITYQWSDGLSNCLDQICVLTRPATISQLAPYADAGCLVSQVDAGVWAVNCPCDSCAISCSFPGTSQTACVWSPP